MCVDTTLFAFMKRLGMLNIDMNNMGKEKHQDDYYFTGNTKAKIHSQIRKGKVTYFRAKGKRVGGTYSGHPTCTTLGNTLRNMLYHYFAIFDNVINAPFYAHFATLPLRPHWENGTRHMVPDFWQMRELIRLYIILYLAGDDTGILCTTEAIRDFVAECDRRIAHTKQERVTHGLGLVLKKPKKDYCRINILSRHIALSPTGPVCIKMIPKLILLNATCSPKVNPYEAHYLAAMNYYSYGMDPLSKKLMKMRLAMIPAYARMDKERVTQAFLHERTYKLGIMKEYSVG